MTQRRIFCIVLPCFIFFAFSSGKANLNSVPQQYKTIQAAIDAAKIGDTVLVVEGLYYENLRIMKDIILASRFILDGDTAHIARTIIDGSRARNPRRASVISIEGPGPTTSTAVIGFSIRGGKGTVYRYPLDSSWIRSGGGIHAFSNGASILHNDIFDNHVGSANDSLIEYGGGIGAETPPGSFPRQRFVIQDNTVEFNSVIGPMSFGGGISADGPVIIERNIVRWNSCRATKHYANGGGIIASSSLRDTVLIAANLVISNTAQRSAGILVIGDEKTRDLVATVINNIVLHNASTERDGGIGAAYANEVLVINNTVMHNHSKGFGGGIGGQYAYMCLMNNIVTANTPEQQVAYQTIFPASHNLIQHGFPGKTTIDEPPEFVDDSTGLMLSEKSPGVGTGTMSMIAFGKTVRAPATDFYGHPRGASPKTNPDLGAVESPYAVTTRQDEDRLLKISVRVRPLMNSEKFVDSTTGFIHTTSVQYFVDDTLLLSDSLCNEGILLERYGTPIHIECIGASPQSYIYYRTTLDGRDFGWTERRGNQLIRYTGLESGSYIFRIQSKRPSHDHPWVESSIRIIVPPPWWEEWWFFTLLIGTTVALVSLVYRRELSRARREKLLQQLFSQKQIESQEAERKRLAGELHDGLGQDLLVANNELQQVLADGSYVREDIQRAADLVTESIESVREISANLHPRQIERLGFCTAVNTMVDKLSHSTAMDIQCRCDQIDDAMTKEAKIHVYRIIQESLTNIVKHSEATAVSLEIRKNQNHIEITIEDNGKGFDTEGASAQIFSGKTIDIARGFGVASMTERARIVGGTLTINSQAQRGTTVHLTLPVLKG